MRQPGHAGPPLPTRHLQILILLKHVQIAGGGTVGLLGPSIFLSPVVSSTPEPATATMQHRSTSPPSLPPPRWQKSWEACGAHSEIPSCAG